METFYGQGDGRFETLHTPTHGIMTILMYQTETIVPPQAHLFILIHWCPAVENEWTHENDELAVAALVDTFGEAEEAQAYESTTTDRRMFRMVHEGIEIESSTEHQVCVCD